MNLLKARATAGTASEARMRLRSSACRAIVLEGQSEQRGDTPQVAHIGAKTAEGERRLKGGGIAQ